jgi:hypothetical protein
MAYVKKGNDVSKEEFVRRVIQGDCVDRTLTALLRYGLSWLEIVENYMEDEESGNSAALLEWKP